MLLWHSPQRLTAQHTLLCVLQSPYPLRRMEALREVPSFCASLCLEKRKNSELCFIGTCRAVPQFPLPSSPQSTAQKPTMTHLPNPPCQAAGQRLGFAFSGHVGIVLESASRAKRKEGLTAFVPNPIPFHYVDCAALVHIMYNVYNGHINVYYIYNEFMCQ